MSASPVRVEYILGGLMVFVGAVSIIPSLGHVDHRLMYVASKLLLMAMGFVIILDPKKSIMRAVGLYAIALGAGRVVRSLVGLTSPDDIQFLFSLAMIALGLNLATCGVTYMNNTSKNARRMTLTAYAIFLAYFLEIVYRAFLGEDLLKLLISKYDTVAFLIMYGVYIVILNSREIRYNIPLERVLMDVDGIGNASGVPKGASISESDLALIREGLTDNPSWNSLESGPAGWETSLKLGGRSAGTIIFSKMRDSGDVLVTLVSDPDGTFLQGSRFFMRSLSLEGDSHAVIRGDDGIYMKIQIRREVAS